MGYFLLFWLIILVCTYGLFLPVRAVLSPFSLEQTALPPCWEQTVRPTYYNAFLEPGVATSTNPAFLVEPFNPHFYNSGYITASQLNSDPSYPTPSPDLQLWQVSEPITPSDHATEGPPNPAGACSIWQG
jgi:hypothetical protein